MSPDFFGNLKTGGAKLVGNPSGGLNLLAGKFGIGMKMAIELKQGRIEVVNLFNDLATILPDWCVDWVLDGN